jgi:peptidoglycan/LPS O-acetylase OafA/YrhL
MMLSGAAELGLVRGKLHSRYWRLTMPLAFVVSGAAFLIHEQNTWFFARAAFLHHLIGWTLIIGAIFPLIAVFQPRSAVWRSGFALTFVVLGVMLYCDRDVAPVFGHLSPLAGQEHR